mmetsp:Transcript_28286/g.30465  ORF Transcript_28286/g.30465 Transcript_28286/m.30465 type:complete len:87 (+) Transcript_28286:186-446(+)
MIIQIHTIIFVATSINYGGRGIYVPFFRFLFPLFEKLLSFLLPVEEELSTSANTAMMIVNVIVIVMPLTVIFRSHQVIFATQICTI